MKEMMIRVDAVRDHWQKYVGVYRSWGECLWDALEAIGLNARCLVCTPGDPWTLNTREEVVVWINDRVVEGDDGTLLRVNLYPRLRV